MTDNNYCPRCDKEFEEGWDWQKHECYVRGEDVMDSVGKQPNAETIKVLAEADAETNVYAKEIWNAAIEAAALKIEGAPMFASEIRRLKK